jgi:putative transposase/transposase-like zinc-binding protein
VAAPGGLAEVLARFGPAYRAGQALSPAQAKAWRAIAACRTAALGGQLERCSVCGATRAVYHSCRNRHCPRCQTRAKEAWLAARRRELLPVPYFHLVFTLPHALNGLTAGQPRTLYETLFAAAAATLAEFAANPRWLGGTPAFSLVLHTWRQDLARHLHVHALVAGGALTAAGAWVSPRRGFLFPVKALSRVFRGKFIAALTAARQAGRLGPAGEPAWRALLTQLYAHDWVVYAKAPLSGPAPVLDYLARYTHRVAISNERIVAIDDTHVAFRVRADAHGAKRTVRLPGPEFIGRFLTHILPPGFKRIRHYGLLGPARKQARLAAARAALGAPQPVPVVVESVAEFLKRINRLAAPTCPHCGCGHFVAAEPIAPLGPQHRSRAPP